MSIETSNYFFNKELHTEIATELNTLASRKNVQVSRWVNNSKGRQIVTYIVHEGERNQFASKQGNVLFKTSEDAGRGGKVYDETEMLTEVRQFLNSVTVEEITNDEPIDGFYYSDDEAIAGEPQFALDLSDEYNGYIDSFGDLATDTPEEFNARWQYVTSDDFDNERFRSNMEIELRFVYFDTIRTFIESELAKREVANV